jgi:hypothetical protein
VRVDPDAPAARALDLGAQIDQRFQHGCDIADFRNVFQDDRPGAQERGREHGQRGVLVAGDRDLTRQAVSSLDDETIQGSLLVLLARAAHLDAT